MKPGFDPNCYRWWDNPRCARGHVARGFDFHAMGTTPRGQHTLKKKPEPEKKAEERTEEDPDGLLY